MKNKPSILLVSYDFPPIGGGGIQRNVKYMKYLNKFGWDTNVLTVKERDYYVFDYSLLEEIKETNIIKSDSFDPASIIYKIKKWRSSWKKSPADNSSATNQGGINEGSFLLSIYRIVRDWLMIPDTYGGWIPFAYQKGKQFIKIQRPTILLATFPYASNAIITYKLAKKFNIPFVIDFRDPWADDPYVKFPTFIHRSLHNYLERKMINAAAQVIVYGDALKKQFEQKYPNIVNKVHVITNGFDPEDFAELQPIQKKPNKIRIVYSGAVYIDRREVYKCFISALSKLSIEHLNKLEVIFVGDKLQWTADLVSEYKLENIVSFTGYLSHKESLEYLKSADIALMFLKKGDTHALTGKIFEYIGLEKPIMACVEPEGACATLLKSLENTQGIVAPDDIEGMTNVLTLFANGDIKQINVEKTEIYSRKYHAKQLEEILNKSI